MEQPGGDRLTELLIPVANTLVSAVHALNAEEVARAFTEAGELAGDELAGARHLAVLCAAWCSEDHSAPAALGWTLNPDAYRQHRAHTDALTASLRAGQTAQPAHEGADA